MMREEILQCISAIDDAEYAAESAVISSMLDVLDKECIIESYCDDNGYTWYQEGTVLDSVKNKSKNDPNSLVSALKFIPRLLGAILRSIVSAIKKSDLAKKLSVLMKKLAGMSDREAKEAYCEKINKNNGGEYIAYVDDKGEIRFKRGIEKTVTDIIELGIVLHNLPDILDLIKHFDVRKNEALDSLIKLTKDASAFDNTNAKWKQKELALDELNITLRKLTAAEVALKSAIDLFDKKLSSDICKDYLKGLENSKKTKFKQKAVNIGTNLSKISGIIVAGIASIRGIISFLDKWIGKPLMNKGKLDDMTTSMKALRVFVKKPGDPSNNKEGMTREDLEKIYPISKNEDTKAYTKRIDEITNDIADVFRVLYKKAASSKTMLEANDKFISLANGTIPPEFDVDQRILKLMRLPAVTQRTLENGSTIDIADLENTPIWNPFRAEGVSGNGTYYDTLAHVFSGLVAGVADGTGRKRYRPDATKVLKAANERVLSDRASKVVANKNAEAQHRADRITAVKNDHNARYGK